MAGTPGRSGGNRRIGSDRTMQDDGPSRPADLPDSVSAKWDELLPQLPTASLRQVDVHELKLLCELLVLADNLSTAMLADPGDHRSCRLFLNTTDRIHRLSAAFGLNPHDRKRLDLPNDKPAEDDPFDMLLARMQGRA